MDGFRGHFFQSLSQCTWPGQAQEQEAPCDHPLSPRQTQDYLLRAVFDAAPTQLARPSQLLLWLDRYHAQGDPVPPVLAERLVEQLHSLSTYADWPLPDLLASPDAFRSFVQDAWSEYVSQTFAEDGPEYIIEGERQRLDFAADEDLQDILPHTAAASRCHSSRRSRGAGA